MNVHQNARLTPQGRALMVRRILDEGWPVADAAAAGGLSQRRAYVWLRRFKTGGASALEDRRSAPARSSHAVPAEMVATIERLRRERLTGDAIARRLGLKRSTVGGVLRRLGLGRLAALDPKPPVIRYQREHPGKLIHVDIKKLGRIARPSHRVTGNRRDAVRGAGWDFVHVAVDDASRLAYTEVLASERQEDATAFLTRALAFFAVHGVVVEHVMTDNRPQRGRSVTADACAEWRTRGNAYRSHLFRDTITAARCRHLRTRPYTPRTNGPRSAPADRRCADGSSALRSMAERFIQTSLREWAYARTHQTSDQRTQAMQPWITTYNHSRPHSALGGSPPVGRLNNLVSFDN